MISSATSAGRTIGAAALLSAALATSTCTQPAETHAACEQNQAVYRRSDGSEISRTACEADEQCIILPVAQALCRLREACGPGTFRSSECRGDDLVRCNPGEKFRQRIHCATDNHEKPIPGRCAPDAAEGADCVDSDAVRCDYAFKDICVGNDRIVCREGYTSIEAACSDDDRAEGGVCRLSTSGRAACAQADAEACPQEDGFGTCVDGKVVTCRDGFVWRHACPEGQSCAMGVRGDVEEAYCQAEP